MIQISSNGSKVVVKLETGIGWSCELDYNNFNEMNAVLLENQLNKKLNQRIEQIRREAYEAGWKDKSDKKRGKRTWFNGNINSNNL